MGPGVSTWAGEWAWATTTWWGETDAEMFMEVREAMRDLRMGETAADGTMPGGAVVGQGRAGRGGGRRGGRGAGVELAQAARGRTNR